MLGCWEVRRRDMIKVSIIIIKTNDNQFSKAKYWIEKQSCADEIEIVAIENEKNKNFKSAATALNYGAAKSQGEVLVFMHQDVYLKDLTIIESYYDYLMNNPNNIVGLAGAVGNDVTYSDIYETENMIKRNKPTNGKHIMVDSLDECMIAINRKKWEYCKFDEKCCDNWHCYAMDLCFSNTLNGGRNIVISAPVVHDSMGNANSRDYRRAVKRILVKYRNTKITRVRGCCINIKCSLGAFYWYCFKMNIKTIIYMLRNTYK